MKILHPPGPILKSLATGLKLYSTCSACANTAQQCSKPGAPLTCPPDNSSGRAGAPHASPPPPCFGHLVGVSCLDTELS